MKSDRVKIYLAFFAVSTIWGSTWLAIKLGLKTVPPFLGAGLRFALASSILMLIVRVKAVPVPTTRDARIVYLSMGLISFTIPFGLVYWGSQFIPSALGSILFAAYPFWVALFSHLFLPKEKLNAYKTAGIAVGFIGLIVIFSPDLAWTGSAALPGMLAVMLSTMLQGFSLIVVKKFGQPISPFAMNGIGMAIGATGLLGLALAVEPIGSAVWTTEAVLSIIYLAVMGSVVTFVSYYWLLKRIEAVYLSLTTFINPIVAVVLGIAIMGERLGPTVLAGAGLVLLGIAIANGQAIVLRIRRRGSQ
jgi:drug/metabolite transporter (DMT)-like permease